MKKVAIIGGGSWGTALALVLAQKSHQVRLWVYEAELVDAINRDHRNILYMPDCELPATIKATHSLAEALAESEMAVMVVPSRHFRKVAEDMQRHLRPETIVVSATKGIENQTLCRMSQILEEVFRGHIGSNIAAISGPSFAKEVARGNPTAIVVASHDRKLAELVQSELSNPTLRLYTSNDMVGVELGGAVKNVIAIAAGVCAGLGYGSNSLAALITRGLAEMTRLVAACGGKPMTLAGLSGIGDLVLTCTGELSRNRSVGLQLGQGKKLDEIIAGMRMVAEGVPTTQATLALARKQHVEMPITEQMDAVLNHGKVARQAIRELMERPLKEE
jgi:glycerol-3-phosphate dehydrogenase (NAD(P)+)